MKTDRVAIWKENYPHGSFPIDTLANARAALVVIVHNIRSAQNMDERQFFQDALDKLYARWPELQHGGVDEVKA